MAVRIKQNKRAHMVRKIVPAQNPDRADMDRETLDAIARGEDTPPEPREEEPSRKESGMPVKSTSEEMEYRQRQVLRLLLRSVPRKTIAQYLGISLATLYQDISEINREMREEVQNMDYPLFIGQTMAFFDEARSLALRMATDQNEKSSMAKIRALSTALQAESEKHRYLTLVGLYKVGVPGEAFPRVAESEAGVFTDDGQDLHRFLEAVTGQSRAG